MYMNARRILFFIFEGPVIFCNSHRTRMKCDVHINSSKQKPPVTFVCCCMMRSNSVGAAGPSAVQHNARHCNQKEQKHEPTWGGVHDA